MGGCLELSDTNAVPGPVQCYMDSKVAEGFPWLIDLQQKVPKILLLQKPSKRLGDNIWVLLDNGQHRPTVRLVVFIEQLDFTSVHTQ